MISTSIREGIRALATTKYGNAPILMTRTDEAFPGTEVSDGDG